MDSPKNVLVLVAATNREYKLEIVPGVTARDVLRQVGIKRGHVKKAGEGYTFGDNEEIYPRVETGCKLVVSPDTPVAE